MINSRVEDLKTIRKAFQTLEQILIEFSPDNHISYKYKVLYDGDIREDVRQARESIESVLKDELLKELDDQA